MAVMLRTQGIATRVVNGFHGGDYNDTADVTVVRQRNAHAWVEVYFPMEQAWVKFDPTPFAGQTSSASAAGFLGSVSKYVEALETFWIQYFVAYDNQGQASLARSVRRGFFEYQSTASAMLSHVKADLSEWWSKVRGDSGMQTSLFAIGNAAAYLSAAVIGILLLGWLYRKIVKFEVWRRIRDRLFARRHASIVEFYDRMLSVLAEKGLTRQPYQTPLEFAFALDMPKAVSITEKYNRVRFGEKPLTADEASEIENWLEELETTD